jgi:hypothetical protein
MKSFNKQIQITVELDTIANALLSTLNPDEKHRDIIVEAIIGRLDAKNDTQGMTALYNSLNGFSNNINFEKGNKVICTKRVNAYWTEESIRDNSPVYLEIGEVTVIDINEYADEKLLIEYNYPLKSGETEKRQVWVDHSTCSKANENEYALAE